MNTKKTFILALLLVLNFTIKAQQLPVYQHSFLIRSAYNPSEVLNENDEISLYALRGNQFQKFQGGFVNNYINFTSPLNNINIGVGLDMASRSYGPINQLSIGFAYAYRVRFNEATSLIFGARLGFMEHRFNQSLVNPYDDDDPTIAAIPTNNIFPNGNFGMTLRSKIGAIEVSIPQLLSNRFLNTTGTFENTITLQPHLYSRYSLDINLAKEKVKLTPIVSVRYLPRILPQFEAGLTALFNQSLWLNVNYRSSYSIAFGAGIRVNENWTIGYSYDAPIINRYSFNANNHEVVFGYTFKRGKSSLPQTEWNQAQTEPKVRMDSISSVQDVTMAEEYLKNKLIVQQKMEAKILDSINLKRSENSNYKSILVEVNMIDSLFEIAHSTTSQKVSNNTEKYRNSTDKTVTNEKLTQKNIEARIKQIEEEEILTKINKNDDVQIKIIRNEQPSENTFVELSGEDCSRGYYLITGVFSTLEKAQNFRWKSDSEMSKIIINNKNKYFYVVYSYSLTKSVKELEPTIKEYKSKNQKIWILDY